jgi:hypothetical protein
MRFLLDAKDLIDVVEHGRPIALADFDEYLRSRGHEIVLTTTNVRELAAPLATDGDFLKMRGLLQGLEALPVCYLREWAILHEELLAAWRAFEGGTRYEGINPYVGRWDETLFPGEASTRIFVNFRLDEIIYRLWRRNPRILLMPPRTIAWMRPEFTRQRNLPASERLSLKENFKGSVGRHLQSGRLCGAIDVSEEKIDVAAFGKWIYSDPRRCPGFRLHYGVYHELLGNVGDTPKDSDLLDFAHVMAVPYADAITMDRRIGDYTTRVSNRLHRQYRSVSYAGRIFNKLAPLLDAFA